MLRRVQDVKDPPISPRQVGGNDHATVTEQVPASSGGTTLGPGLGAAALNRAAPDDGSSSSSGPSSSAAPRRGFADIFKKSKPRSEKVKALLSNKEFEQLGSIDEKYLNHLTDGRATAVLYWYKKIAAKKISYDVYLLGLKYLRIDKDKATELLDCCRRNYKTIDGTKLTQLRWKV